MLISRFGTAISLAERIRRKEISATDVIDQTLHTIEQENDRYNCFTRILKDRAVAEAKEIDRKIQAGLDPGSMAGVPYAAKDLFDIQGIPTTAGSKVRQHAIPAKKDAEVIRRMNQAGAILVGTLNMDEFAYGFATVNAHYGTTRNPHDVNRLAGGSSGGSAAAVSAGFVPLSLGSDTNGSVRVPAALCGLWSIRPAENVIPMQGVFPFVKLLDTVGPFSRSLADLVLSYEVLSGKKSQSVQGTPRIAKLSGWFIKNSSTEVMEAVDTVSSAIGKAHSIELFDAEAARSASYLITAAQGGALHFDTLKHSAMDYDPAVRDRLIAGTMLPAGMYLRALEFREFFRSRIHELLQRFDILVSATTPIVAPLIREATMLVNGVSVPARAHLGLYTQPLSIAGIPIISAPWNRPTGLPIGIQFATAPGREQLLFQFLAKLEYDGLLRSTPPALIT